jgi:hypothetical protein
VADLLRVAVVFQGERDDLPARLADSDRREGVHPQSRLDLRVDTRVAETAVDVPLFDQFEDRWVGRGDPEVLRRAPRRILALEEVARSLLVVDPSADQAEVVLKIVDETPEDLGQRGQEVVGSLDRAEVALDLAEEVLVVHGEFRSRTASYQTVCAPPTW